MSEGNKTVKRLEKLYDSVREKPRGAVVLTAVEAADLLDYVAELESTATKLRDHYALTEPLELGDRVHEAGYPDETGLVISFRSGGDARMFTVKRDHPGEGLKTINYYREELVLVEKANEQVRT